MTAKTPSVRAQQVIDWVRANFYTGAELYGVEIGVCDGRTSADLLRAFSNLRLLMVDPWFPPPPNSDYAKTGDKCSKLTHGEHIANMAKAIDCTDFAASRRRVCRDTSEGAACLYTRYGEQFDFVFVDADHSFSGCLNDCRLWWPAIKSGGILCGHDYLNLESESWKGFKQVKEAVDAFSSEKDLPVTIGKHATWKIEKP